MDIQRLHEFIVLAETMSFTNTAGLCSSTQATISRHIADLEKEMNSVLVDRREPMALTSAGVIFLECAQKLVHLYRSTIDALAKLNCGMQATIRINECLDDGQLLARLSSVKRYLSETYPGITINLVPVTSIKSVPLAVQQGKIDIGIFNTFDGSEKSHHLQGLKNHVLNWNDSLLLVQRIMVKNPAEHIEGGYLEIQRILVPSALYCKRVLHILSSLLEQHKQSDSVAIEVVPCNTYADFFTHINDNVALITKTAMASLPNFLFMQYRLLLEEIELPDCTQMLVMSSSAVSRAVTIVFDILINQNILSN